MREISPEPWRVKVVERIRSIGPSDREEALRRAGTNSHLEYVAEVVKQHRNPEKLRGVRIVRQAPVLRHFTAQFELV